MSEFKIHTASTAPGKSAPLLENVEKSFGFVPNLAAVMAESPAMLEGYFSLSAIFNKSNLSETERQVILMTNNRLNGCDYCMAAHTTISQMKNVPQDVIDSLRENRPIADPKLEVLRQFSEKVNVSRGWPSNEDIQELIEAGYTQATVLEVVLGTALKVLSNYTNHVAETPVDPAFAKNEWNRETVTS